MTASLPRVEFLVAGAGPAGLTVARLLACKGRCVVVVDPEVYTAKRLELIAPAALQTIAAAGLASLLADPAIARPCLGVRRRWDTEAPVYEDFLRHPWCKGYVVDRARFDAGLRAAATAVGVAFLKARITGVAEDADGLCATVDRNGTPTLLRAGTIIDATGRPATVARRRGARVVVRDHAIAELISDSSDEADSGAPEWLDVHKLNEASWLYQVRGPGGRAQIWRIYRDGASSAPAALQRVDASARILSRMAARDWIAVGDAASAFDPITSQGLFHALSSALVATGALLSRMTADRDPKQAYSDAVTAAFLWSEAGRSQVYGRSAIA